METKMYGTAWLAGLATWGATAVAAATPVATIPVEARVTQDGLPIEGTMNLEVRLYTEPRAGRPIYAEGQNVEAHDGRLSFSVGDAVALDLVELTRSGELWMALAVDGHDEMTPRIRFGTVPFAARAGAAGDAARLGGKAPDAYASASHRHSLHDLTGVPESWLDGDDVRSEFEIRRFARLSCYDTPEELTEVLDARYAAIDADPYRGLFREGRLDGQDADDLLTVRQAANRFLQPHVPLAGDVVTTGDFRWATARSRTVVVPGASFVVAVEPDSGVAVQRRASALGLRPGGAGGELEVFAPIRLPVGASLETVACSAADESGAADLAFDLRLGARRLTDVQGSELAQLTLVTQTTSGTVQVAQAGLQSVVRADHEYYMTGTLRSDVPSTEVRFLGCAVTLRQAGPG